MKTLFVSDLDGTLLNSKTEISPYTADVINRMLESGHLFSYATARSYTTASAITGILKIDFPVIVYNGAFITYSKTGEILYSCKFRQEEISFVREVFQRFRMRPFVYAFVDQRERVSWIPENMNSGMDDYVKSHQGDPRMRPVWTVPELFLGDIFYFTCIGTQQELSPVVEIFKEDTRFRCTFQRELYREEFWFEVMPRRASKARAILKLKELTGCTRIVSFGDAVNDIPMFEISDECYAVENAVPELKKMADGILRSNDENGVAHWLEVHCFHENTGADD